VYKISCFASKILSVERGRFSVFDVKKPEMVNKTFRFPAELVKQLETVAQNKGVSLNNLVVQCCEYALDNLKDSDESK
jgi:hypothetical protein